MRKVFLRVGVILTVLLVVFSISGSLIQAAAPETSFIEKINDIQTKVTNILNYLTNTTNGLPGIETDIAAITGKLDDANTGLSGIKGGINNVSSDLDIVSNYLTNTTNGLPGIKTDIGAVNSKLVDEKNGLGFISAGIDTIDSEIDGLAGLTEKINTNTTNLKNYNDTLDAKLAEIKSNMVKMESGSATHIISEYSPSGIIVFSSEHISRTVHVSLTLYASGLNHDEDEVFVRYNCSTADLSNTLVKLKVEGSKIFEFDASPDSVSPNWALKVYNNAAGSEHPIIVFYSYTMTYPAQ